MNDVLAELFSGNRAADIAFWVIVGTSFLLGMLTFVLLAYWPAKRRLNRELKRLRKENELLTRDHKDLSERFNTMNAQYKRVQEDWQITTTKLKEQEGTVGRQQREIQYLKEELEAYKAQARNYQQANNKLLDKYQQAAKSNEGFRIKLEDLKDLVEEVEQERSQLQQDYRKNQREEDCAQRELAELKQRQQAWRLKNQQLKSDLSAALAQRKELKELLQQLEDQQVVGNSTDEELRQQVLDMKRHLKALEEENAELMQRLAPYLADEQQDQKDQKEIEPLLVELYIEAEESLNSDGFFVAYNESELVEDPQKLAKALQNMEVSDSEEEQEKAAILVDEQEAEEMQRSLSQAELAMERQGFYKNMHEAVLIPLSEEVQGISAEELLQKRLQDTAEVMEESVFYNKDLVEGDLVEQKELLELELAKLDEVPMARGLESAIEEIDLSEEEQYNLVVADEMAETALNQPGLYAPIEAAHLLADTKYQEPVYHLEDFSEQRYLETLVVQEQRTTIPKANPEERDNLQEIDGIGHFMEQQLNQLGVYTYKQISLFDNNFIDTLSAALDFPASVIHEKEWVAQARNRLNRP